MESTAVIRALAALAHEGRLAAFKLLVHAGATGMAAGRIASELHLRPNTLSNHLAVLSHAGLATSRRDGRSIIYCADFGSITQLLQFLLSDCCGARPEACAPLAQIFHSADAQARDGAR